MRRARRHDRHLGRRIRTLPVAFAVSAVLLGLLPILPLPVAAGGPIKVVGREVSAAVERQRTIPLPFDASHVALRWTGAHDARLTIAFGQRPNELGAEVPVAIDHGAEGDAADDSVSDAGNHGDAEGSNGPDPDHPKVDPGETHSGVIWTGGARFARVTTDRPLGQLKILAMDAHGGSGRHTAALGLGGGVIGLRGGAVANAAVPGPTVISRAGWNADEDHRFDSGGYERFPPHFAAMQKAIVHHTAGRNNDPDPEATIRAIYYMHAVDRGYGDIDYNYLIDWQGRVYEGRHARAYAAGETITGEDLAGNVVRGAHARDFNDATVGIALLGNFTSVLPPAAQRTALEKLLAWKLERHGINPLGAGTYTNPRLGNSKDLNNISGHRNVNATACPGDAFYATFPALRQAVADRIAATTGSAVDHAAPSVLSLRPIVPETTGSLALPFGLTFDEPIAGLEPKDLAVGGTSDGWTVGSITGAASTWQVYVVAPEGPDLPAEGTVTLTLADTSVNDLAGNVGPPAPVESTVNYAADDDHPTVVLWQEPHESTTNASGFDWTATFSEPVTGLKPEDIEIGGPDADEWRIKSVIGAYERYAFSTRQEVASNGIFTVSIPDGVTDLAGNPVEPSSVITMTIDRTAPSAPTTPQVKLRAGTTLKDHALRVNVSWAGTDSGPAGVASYDVRRSYDGAPPATISSAITSSNLDWTMNPGHTYRFEVRTRDRAGNVGPWKSSATLKPALTQQTSGAISWSGPSTATSYPGYSGGSQRSLGAAGASATYTTTARSLSFITTISGIRGTVKVYVDGSLEATIDLNEPVTTYRYAAVAKSWSSVGTHTIKVVSLGSPLPRVDVDAFGVIR